MNLGGKFKICSFHFKKRILDLSNLKFQYASTNKKIDIVEDKSFIDKFISNYNYFPSKYSIRAYDITYDLRSNEIKINYIIVCYS